MKKIVLFSILLLSSVLAGAQDYSSCYDGLEVPIKQVSPVQIADYSVSLTDFGGVGDGLTLNTEAFQKAISALRKQGGGWLYVPAGVYMTGPISLKSGIGLRLDRNAIIMATEDKAAFVKVEDGKPVPGRVRPLISASKCENVAITGEGIIDGNGAQWRPVKRSKTSDAEWSEFKYMGGKVNEDGSLWYAYDLKGRENIADDPEEQESMRADAVQFNDCKNVLVEGVTIQNSPRFHLHPTRCENLIIDEVTVRCPWNAQNGDAIDLSNCRVCLITRCTVDAGDDGICMKGGTGPSGVKYGPCEDILIQDNTVFHAHGGFVIGSDVSGGMKNIVVRRCRFSGTDVGLRFKSGIGRGGPTEGIRISDIVMTDIKDEAIIFECTYIDKKYNFKESDSGKPIAVEFAPDFKDIKISRVVCHNSKTAIRSVGVEGLRCVSDVHIEDCCFYYTKADFDIDTFSSLDISGCKFIKAW